MSVRCIENEDYNQLKRCDLDITPNSHVYQTKKFIGRVKRMNVSILGMKGLIPGGGGGGKSHKKQMGMLVVSLRGVNFGLA